MSESCNWRPILRREKQESSPIRNVDHTDVLEFHKSLPSYSPTPLISLESLAKDLNIKAVLIKDESSRLSLPSFKILGASWGTFRAVTARLGLSVQTSVEDLSLAAQRHSFTLFAATDGNHGRAVAFMAKLLHIPAQIYVPHSVDEHTRNLIVAEGATVLLIANDYDATVAEAAKAAKSIDGILIQDTSFQGYEEIPKLIIEGYSTLFHEIEIQVSSLGMRPTTIISPVGVGSLAEAVVTYSNGLGRGIKVVTVEPTAAACLYESLQSGRSTSIQTSQTIMSGMDCGTVSLTAWPSLRDHVDISVTVSDLEAHRAVEYLSSQGIDSGPCGAAGLAALKRLASENQGGTFLDPSSVVVLLSTEGSRPYLIPHDADIDIREA